MSETLYPYVADVSMLKECSIVKLEHKTNT